METDLTIHVSGQDTDAAQLAALLAELGRLLQQWGDEVHRLNSLLAGRDAVRVADCRDQLLAAIARTKRG